MDVIELPDPSPSMSLTGAISCQLTVGAGTDIEHCWSVTWRTAQSTLINDKFRRYDIRASTPDEQMHGMKGDRFAKHEARREPFEPILIRLEGSPKDRTVEYQLGVVTDDETYDTVYNTTLLRDTELVSKVKSLWDQWGEAHAIDWFGRSVENRIREISGLCSEPQRTRSAKQRKDREHSAQSDGTTGEGSSASAMPPAPTVGMKLRPLVVSRTGSEEIYNELRSAYPHGDWVDREYKR